MAFAIITSLLLSAAVAIYYWVRSKATYFERHGFLTTRPTFPYGHFKGVGTKHHMSHVLKQLYEKFKNKSPVHGLYRYFMSPIFVVTDLDVIKDILIKDFDHFRNRTDYDLEHDVLSNHLFTIKDEAWRTMRTNLSPSFTSGKMKTMFHTVLEISNQLVACMEKEDTEIVDVKEVLARFTTDVIGNVAFGLESNSLQDPNSAFRTMGLKYFNFDRRRQLSMLMFMAFPNVARRLKICVTPKDVSEFFIGTIYETVDYRRKNKIERRDFLDLLMKIDNGGEPLSVTEMTAQSFLFWIAGFESSSTTGTFCLYLLSLHQDIQDKLRHEIRTTLSKHENQISYEAMAEMKYLQMVIDETLRLYGPVVNLVRKAEEDYRIPNTELVIPKGKRVFIPIHAIHTDADLFPEPEKFIPERFSDDNKNARHPMAHLPFGNGQRNCLGLRFGLMQTKISIISLLMKFKFSPSSKTLIPMVLHPSAIVMSPRDGMHLKVERL